MRNLWVAPLADPNAGRPVTRATDRDIGWSYRWAYTSRHLIFFRDHDGDENWRGYSIDLDSGSTVLLTPESGVKSFIQELGLRFPDEALLRHNERDKRFFDLYRVNLVSGKAELVFQNPPALLDAERVEPTVGADVEAAVGGDQGLEVAEAG